MKKVNRLVAILLAAILTTGSLQTYAFAGETAAPEKEEAIENVAAYEDAEPEAVSETAAGEDFEANAEETSAEEDSSMAEEDDENSTEESFNAGNDVTTSGATEIPAEDFSEEPLTSFTVTLEGNGGVFVNEWDDILKEDVDSSEVLNKFLSAGDAVTSFPVYEQENQEAAFLGWSLERDGDLVTQGYEEYVPIEDCVLYAVWEITVLTDTDEKEVLEPDMDILEEPALPETDMEDSIFNENAGDEGYEDADGEAADSEHPDSNGENANSENDMTQDDPALTASDQENNNDQVSDENNGETSSVTADKNGDAELTDNSQIIEDDSANQSDDTQSIISDETEDISSDALGASESVSGSYTYTVSNGAATLTKYEGSSSSVSVPSSIDGYPVKAIGNNLFKDHTEISSVTLPSEITSIGNYAFSGCSSLRSLTLPEELKELGYNFLEGTKVSYLKIPKKLTYSCTRLSWDGPCEGALELKKVEFEEGMTAIPGNTCSSRDHASYIEEIILPESIKTIGENAFRNCKRLTSVSLPKNISSIGSSAFNGCSKLDQVNFQRVSIEGVDSLGLSYQLQIGNDAFSSCPVSELTLPGGTIVGQNAFSNCTSLTKLVFRESYSLPTIEQIEISQAASEDRDIHKLDISWQIGFGSGKSAVNANAFSGCTALKSVTFPMNLTSIGDNAFNGCAALTEAFYPLGTNAWSAVNVSTKGNTSLTEAVEMLQNGENTNSVKRFLVQIRPDTSTKWKNAQQEYVTFKPAQLRQSKTIETEVKSKDYYIRICSVPDHSDGVAIYGDWSEEKHIQVTNVVTEADVKKSVEEFYKGLEEYRKALNKAVRASKNNYKTSAKTPGQVLRETDEASDHRIITFTLPDGKGSYALSEADKNDVYDAFAQYLESLEAFDIGKIKASSDKTMTKQAVAIVNQIKKSIENASEKKQYTMPSNKTVWIDPTGGFSDTSAGTIRMSNHPTYVAIYVPEKKTAETMNAYLKNLADCVDELLYESLSSVLSELMDVTGGKQFLNEKTDEIIKEIVENGYGIGLMSAGYGDLKKVLVGYRDTKKLLDSIKNATTRTNLVEVLKDSENIWKQIEEIDLSDEAVDNALIKAATDKVENLRKTVAHSLYCYTYGLEPDEEVNKFVMKLRKMGIACPVDFTITKSNGMVVGKVVNGRASFEPQLSILIDGNTKEVWMPADATYRISFTGTGSGSMSYTVQDYANGEVVDRLDYYDIPLEEGTSYAQKISSGDLSEQVDLLTLNSGSQEYIPERRTAEDEEDPVYVKVTATALAGGSISESASGGDMLKGDIVHLKAVPDEGYEFAGWYLDDILKESREDYYFAAVTDTSLEARFVKKSVVSSQYGAQISDEYKEQLKIVVIDNNDTPQADPSEGEDESSVRFIFNNNKEQTGEPEETITVILLQYDGQNGEPVRVTASLVLQEDGTYLLDKIDLSNYEKIEVESADGKPMGTLCGKEQIHKEPCPDGEHLFEETEEKAATYTEEGIIKKVCIFCNLELTETIPVMEPKSINEAEVTGITNKVYTGKALTQTPVLKIGSDKLEMGKDYTLSYKNNKNAGTATMTITGKDVYSGTMTKTFKINPAPISKATISGLAAKTYTGKAITQKPVVKSGTTTLKEKTDYTVSYKNNKNAGTATVNIAGKGNYTGSKSATFKINKASIAKAKVTCPASKVFTGSALTPVPTVKLGSVTLKKGTNFSLSYKNNKNVGTASITITGKGNYSGTLKKTFKILPKATSISKLSPGNKKLTVNWKKQASQTTGYQIQYSSRTDFKTQKTITVDNVKTVSKAISGLAKKHKYYVRVRTFKTVGKTKYYSAWSAKKAATTK